MLLLGLKLRHLKVQYRILNRSVHHDLRYSISVLQRKVHVQFIHIPNPPKAKKTRKKYNLFFLIPSQFLAESNVFLIKVGCIFPEYLGIFLCVFYIEKFTCHSFIQSQSYYFGAEKNSFFIHSIDFSQKCVKNKLCRQKIRCAELPAWLQLTQADSR